MGDISVTALTHPPLSTVRRPQRWLGLLAFEVLQGMVKRYVSSFQSMDTFGPLLRQEAIRRGMGSAGKVVVLIDGAAGLANMGRLCCKDCLQIVDFFHAMEQAWGYFVRNVSRM